IPGAVLLVALAVGTPARAQVAGPGSELSVQLLTFGPGDQVWERFGHDAIWIHDPVRGTDWVYNYGIFDFNSPGYWRRFIKGNWIYQIGAADIYQMLAEARYFNRTLTAQELRLTPAQKLELQRFLNWNMLPENREYLYDYYTDNCATRVRDALDRVLGGRLHAATADVPTSSTYRSQSRRFMAAEPVVYTALDAGLGPAADQQLSQWEEMFLPEKVAARISELRVPGADGELVPLVDRTRVLYEARGREPIPAEPPQWIPRYLLLGILIGGLIALLGGAAARRTPGTRFAFSLVTVAWSLLMGVGGLLLVGLWAFTNHAIAYRNENLFQFTPLALPLVLLVPALVFGARWARRPARVFALAVAASSLLGFVLQALPWFDQVNGQIVALVLPVNVALAWAVQKVTSHESRVTTSDLPSTRNA
ncbi:MAG TPA: DUF4105 domain-containing protein, partial [Longimicrobiaceae bacterium]|nr:DUF4105 domain-containing protein [Longimicrobiaceae bacterium]